MRRRIAGAALVAASLIVPRPAGAAGPAATVPTRSALAASCGSSYSPAGVDFCLLTGIMLFDYDRVWPHRAPDPLRFRVEYTLGAIIEPATRLMTSVNMIAQYAWPVAADAGIKPYLGAGIGVIYTDYKVEGQGLRFNFNPLINVGVEFGTAPARFVELRLHHISNGGLDDENRGVNSLQLMFGRSF